MLDVALLAAGGVALIVGTVFGHLERWSITPPLIGLLTGICIGPRGLDVLAIPPSDDAHVLQIASRLLLAVALMAIALRYPITEARRRIGEVAVLILIVLPVMATVLALGAMWSLGLPIGVAIVLGAVLSPTDPVLASGIVTGKPAEQAIPTRDRQVLSYESGANDGLAMPLVLLAIAVALERSVPFELAKAAYEVLAGVVVGALAGVAAGRALRWAEAHREIGPAVRSLYTLVLAAFVLGLNGLLHTNGLISVFAAGLLHNRVVSGGERAGEVQVDEALNQFLVIPVFVLLGAVLPWEEWARLGWGGAGFVAVALLLRRLPIVLALRRPLGATPVHTLWLGWFGPIGVAALFYIGHAEEASVTDPRLWGAGTLVIAVSTIVHGLTAGPGRLLYRRASTTR